MRHALDLWSWEGRVSRKAYLIAGLCLFALKYPLDVSISALFGQPWHPLMYLSPRVSPLFHASSPWYWLSLFVVALPFIGAGVSLSARRLRDMGFHPFWAGLFFFPFVHFAFFFLLAVVPSKEEPVPEAPSQGPYRRPAGTGNLKLPPPPALMRLIPRTRNAAVLLGVLLSLGLGFFCYMITVQIHQKFGALLFLGLPFGMGFTTAFVVCYHQPGGTLRAINYGVAPVLISYLLLMAFDWEGVGCLVMALPIVWVLAALGAIIGRLCAQERITALPVILFFALPGLMGLEAARPALPTPLAVVSEITIKAPAEKVWQHVISFPPIDSRPEPIFALVAMPIEARIDGHDPGATRRCIFTNGEFVEPIEVWNEPRELTFGVRTQPESINDLAAIKKGQFLLSENADGTTTLRGTTWLELKVHPAGYWRWWAQKLLHAIHMRVLNHIQRIAEEPQPTAHRAPPVPEWIAASHATCKCTRLHVSDD